MSTLLAKTGIGQLTAILEEHIKTMEDKNDTVDKIIDSAQTAQSLRDAKRKALENEKALLLSIMEDIDEMNSFLKNIILIENLFNQNFQPYKQQQEEARAKYAPNIAKYEQKPKVQSKTNSFVELIFGGQTHVSSFQTWIDKVVKQCDIQNVKILKNSNAKVKKIERAFYKAFYVYSEQDGYKEMTDILRCSLVFDDFDNLYQCFSVIEQLAEATTGGILRVKDRYHPAQMPFGYRDLLINIFCPESPIIAEIQLHFIEFYKYKKISHTMYKRARLFERNDCNLAYDYAAKFLRPKLGTFKVYQVSEDDIEDDDDNKESKETSLADMKYNVLLKDWGLEKYIAKMGDEGWDETADWKELTDEDLKNDIGMSKGHIKKFRRRYEEWLKNIAQEESKKNIAVYQEQVYANPQPQMQLKKDIETKQQEYEMKQNDDGEWDQILKRKKELIKNLTVMVQIRVAADAGTNRIGVILGTYPNQPNVNLEVHTNGRLRFFWNNGQIDLYGTTNVCDGKKHIVTFVRDCNQQRTRIYLDGMLEAEVGKVGSDTTSENFLIGKDNRNEKMAFKGDILKINVFSTAFDERKIQDMINKWNAADSFIGNDCEIEKIYNNNRVPLNQSFTLMTLIRIWSELWDNQRAGVILGTYPKNPNINFEIHQQGAARVYWNNGQIDMKANSKNLNDGKKHCVIFMRDVKNKNFSIYIDGNIECKKDNVIGKDFDYLDGCFLFGRDYRYEKMQFKGDILRLQSYSTAFTADKIKQVSQLWLNNDEQKQAFDNSPGIKVKEFRKGSWNDKLKQTLDFINNNLVNKGQFIDIALTMSNTDWLACFHIYYIENVNRMKDFNRNPADYSNYGDLKCEWNRYSESWMNSAQKTAKIIEKYAKINNKLFTVKHACGNHAYTHGGPVTFVFYWTLNDKDIGNVDGSVMVKEFRKGSWNDKIKQTLEFINSNLDNYGQLIDIALTMANTDWNACIHVYYIFDVNVMKNKFYRNPKQYVNYGTLKCDWDTYSESWMSSAQKAAIKVDKYAKLDSSKILFGVEHACGNHAFTHGGPVIFTFYNDTK